MHHNDEDRLFDELFADSAGMQDFPYEEEAWAAMSAQLDERDHRRRLIFWIWCTGASILLVALLSAGYHLVQRYDQNTTSLDIPAQTTPTLSTVEQLTPPASPTATAGETLDENNTVLTATKQEPNTEETSVAASSLDLIHTVSSSNRDYPSSDAPSHHMTYEPSRVSVAHTRSTVLVHGVSAEGLSTTSDADVVHIDDQAIQTSAQDGAGHRISSTDGPAYTEETIDGQVPRPAPSVDQRSNDITAGQRSIPILRLTHIDMSSNSLTYTASVPVKRTEGQETAKPIGIRLGIHAAPEWSGANSLDGISLGWRAGGDVTITFGQRWTASLGLAYSKKRYEADGSTYDNNEGWTEDIKPMTIKAKCQVIDVPILVRRHFGLVNQSGFFVEAGLSNYILDSEWYGFEYSASDTDHLAMLGKAPLEEVSIDQSMSRHWMGVGQFAIGYQHRVSDIYYISASPYISVPFTGIGEGSVKFQSVGIRLVAQVALR